MSENSFLAKSLGKMIDKIYRSLHVRCFFYNSKYNGLIAILKMYIMSKILLVCYSRHVFLLNR